MNRSLQGMRLCWRVRETDASREVGLQPLGRKLESQVSRAACWKQTVPLTWALCVSGFCLTTHKQLSDVRAHQSFLEYSVAAEWVKLRSLEYRQPAEGGRWNRERVRFKVL